MKGEPETNVDGAGADGAIEHDDGYFFHNWFGRRLEDLIAFILECI